MPVLTCPAFTFLCIVFTMSTVEYIWDAENTKHLARHKITPWEAEEALEIEPLVQRFRSTPAKITKWQQRMYFQDK